jgi:hypothetical protein
LPAGTLAQQPSTGSREGAVDKESGGAQGAVLDLLTKLGYDRSTLAVVQTQLLTMGPTAMERVQVNKDLADLAYGDVPEGTTDVNLLKLLRSDDPSAPALLKPDSGMAGRIAGALGLLDQGYAPVTWLPEKDPKEYRKYATFGNYQVCTNRVIIITDPDHGSLQALFFGRAEIPPGLKIGISREAAVGKVPGDGSNLTASHVDLVFLLDHLSPKGEQVLHWEVVKSDGTVKYVNCKTGYVVPYQLGV